MLHLSPFTPDRLLQLYPIPTTLICSTFFPTNTKLQQFFVFFLNFSGQYIDTIFLFDENKLTFSNYLKKKNSTKQPFKYCFSNKTFYISKFVITCCLLQNKSPNTHTHTHPRPKTLLLFTQTNKNRYWPQTLRFGECCVHIIFPLRSWNPVSYWITWDDHLRTPTHTHTHVFILVW